MPCFVPASSSVHMRNFQSWCGSRSPPGTGFAIERLPVRKPNSLAPTAIDDTVKRTSLFVFLLFFHALMVATCDAQEKGSVLCFFGDSITEGWMDASLHPDLAFPAVIDSILKLQALPISVLNMGKAGETTEDGLARIQAGLLAAHPTDVVIAFGSNDLFIPGFTNSPRVPLDRFRRNLEMLVRIIRDRGIRVLLLGLPPIIEAGYYTYVDPRPFDPFGGANRLNRDYDQQIRTVAATTRAPYVSVPFDTSATFADCFGRDGQHPSARGHRLISQALVPHILTQMQQAPPLQDGEISVTTYPQLVHASSAGYVLFTLDVLAGDECSVVLYDASGREIRRLNSTAADQSRVYILWDLSTSEHHRVSSGMYFARIETPHMDRIDKVLVY